MSGNSTPHGSDHAHGSYRSYITGFLLAVVLTIIPFWIVMGDVLDNRLIAIAIIFAMGSVQIYVHIHYFLHVSLGAEEGWQAMALAFTVIIVVICLAGSIWVMFHLHENMMPAHDQIERVIEQQ